MQKKLNPLLFSFIILNFFSYQLLQAQFIKGNGNITKTERNVSGFKFIDVEDGIDIYLSQGNSESLTIEADENLHQYIKTEIDGDNLKIKTTRIIRKAKTLKVFLTIKDIKGLSISSGADLYTENIINLNSLSLICSGGSDARLKIEASELKCKVSGGSDAHISGKAGTFKAKASGGSDIKAFKLKAKDCYVETTGGSDAEIHCDGKLLARASGGSDVTYNGNPTNIDSNMSGGSSLHHH